jgi:hypothetical protein
MYVSVTEVQSFKRCRRQWHYGSFNRMGITPIMQPKPYLDLGSMIHKTLAYWTEKPDLGAVTLQQVFLAIATQHRRATLNAYVAATGSTPTLEEQTPLLDAIALGAAMMQNYQEYYTVPLPAHLKYCAPEQEILIPIPGTEHTCTDCNLLLATVTNVAGNSESVQYVQCSMCNGTGTARHYLKARLDALAIDQHDNLYVVERKTYEKRPDLNLLEVNDQFIGYVWAAQQLDMGRVVGVAYDGMWKRATPPQRPNKLTIADLFVRTIIQPAQDEVDEYGTELARTVMEMANDPYIYKNRVWQGCFDCSFEYLCRTQSQNGDMDYVLRTMYMSRTEDDTIDIVKQVESNPLIGAS